jgi:hypothetical protein
MFQQLWRLLQLQLLQQGLCCLLKGIIGCVL